MLWGGLSVAQANTSIQECLIIGDSQIASSPSLGLSFELRKAMEDRGIRPITYAISSSSAAHWSRAEQNPLRKNIMTGPLRVLPENEIITNLDANSDRSLLEQILHHHSQRLGRPPQCILFQLGDNAPRNQEVRRLMEQWRAVSPHGQCLFLSPTWGEPEHPDNQYRFKTDERAITINNEIANEIESSPHDCQQLSTANDSPESLQLRNNLRQSAPYTRDGLHINNTGARLLAQAIDPILTETLGPSSTAAVAEVPAQESPQEAPPAAQPPAQAPEVMTEAPVLPAPPDTGEGEQNIVFDDPEETEPPVPQAEEEEEPQVAQEPTESEPESEGTPTEVADVQDPESAPQYQVFELVCRSNLNMRVAPGINHTLLGKIPCRSGNARSRVAVLEVNPDNGWMRVLHNGEVAWVSGDFLRPTEESISLPRLADAEARPGELSDCRYLNFRAGPSTSHTILGTFNCTSQRRPTSVQILGRDPDTGWFLVESRGNRGFVSPRHVTTHGQVAREIANINDVINCNDQSEFCLSQVGTAPEADCETQTTIHHQANWLPHCEVLATQPNRQGDFDRLNLCYNSIRDEILRGLNRQNPNRNEAFRRMYRRLNEREQHFLAMTLTALGESGILTRGPNPNLDEMTIVMKVIENRTREANRRNRGGVNELDIVLQDRQFSMYNRGEHLWSSGLKRSTGDSQRRNAIASYIRHQNISYDNPDIDRVYHYHANYVSPGWRVTRNIVRPTVNGVGLRSQGTRHIFYRDIRWGFQHNPWSGK